MRKASFKMIVRNRRRVEILAGELEVGDEIAYENLTVPIVVSIRKIASLGEDREIPGGFLVTLGMEGHDQWDVFLQPYSPVTIYLPEK